MATITKRGKSYLIRCYAGYSVDGKQITKSMTYRPEPGMTPAKIKKEVQRQAVLFEESVKAGECDGKRIKFEKFAEQWLKDYAEVELAPKTVYDYRKLLPSINAYIGHLYLDDIRPKHLIQMREAIANTPAETMYVVRSILKGMLKKCGLNTYAALQQATGLCEDTISRATKKSKVSKETAWFKDFVRRNDLPDIHLHSLRHTAATLLIDGNCPITAVAGTLGHATPRDHDHHLRPRHSAGYRKVCCGHAGLVWKQERFGIKKRAF